MYHTIIGIGINACKKIAWLQAVMMTVMKITECEAVALGLQYGSKMSDRVREPRIF